MAFADRARILLLDRLELPLDDVELELELEFELEFELELELDRPLLFPSRLLLLSQERLRSRALGLLLAFP